MVILILLMCFVPNLIRCDVNNVLSESQVGYQLNAQQHSCKTSGDDNSILVYLNKSNKPCLVQPSNDVIRGETVNIKYKNELNCSDNHETICVLNHIIYTTNENVDEQVKWSEYSETPLNVPKKGEGEKAPEMGDIMNRFKPSVNVTYSFRFYYIPKPSRDPVSEYMLNNVFYAMSECSTRILIQEPRIIVTTTEKPITVNTAESTRTVPNLNTSGNSTDNGTMDNPMAAKSNPGPPAWVYAVGGLAAVAAVTMVAQTAGIMYFKAKAAKRNTEANLSVKRSDLDNGNDSTRYSTMPGQKATKIPPVGRKKREKEQERESKIYETVNINMTEMKPPEPPAISTLPRLLRNAKADTHLAPPLTAHHRIQTPQASPMMRNRELPRPVPATPISQRPPIALPTEEEHYEDVVFEKEEIYEPPPIIQTQQQLPFKTPAVVKNVRNPIPVPPKPVDRRPTAAAILNVTAKPKPNPRIKPPNPVHEPVTSELDNILKKRRNVIQVPVQSIPEQNTSKINAPVIKPKPPPVVKKPIMQPPVEETEPYYDDNLDSSDEEWTYEPLKPIDHNNIYNF